MGASSTSSSMARLYCGSRTDPECARLCPADALEVRGRHKWSELRRIVAENPTAVNTTAGGFHESHSVPASNHQTPAPEPEGSLVATLSCWRLGGRKSSEHFPSYLSRSP